MWQRPVNLTYRYSIVLQSRKRLKGDTLIHGHLWKYCSLRSKFFFAVKPVEPEGMQRTSSVQYQPAKYLVLNEKSFLKKATTCKLQGLQNSKRSTKCDSYQIRPRLRTWGPLHRISIAKKSALLHFESRNRLLNNTSYLQKLVEHRVLVLFDQHN